MIAVARALSRRGHAVAFCGNAFDEHLAERLGVSFHAAAKPWDVGELARRPELLHPMAGSARLMREVILPRVADTFRDMLALAEADARPDLLVGHHTSFAVPWLAERLGIPWAMAAVAPASWPSLENPSMYPGMPDRDHYRRPLLQVGMAAGRWYTNRTIDPPLNAARRELGLPPIRSAVFDTAFSGSVNLGLWPEVFRVPAPDDPPRTVAVGFPRWPAGDLHAPLPEPIERFLSNDAPTPVLAITLGTTAVHQGHAVIAAALDACSLLGVRAIVLGGDPRLVVGRPGTVHAAWADHQALFGRVDAVLHHGGIGTTAACLHAGRPAIVVPFTHDQPDNARRSRLLGVSRTVQRKKAATAEGLREAIDDVVRSIPLRERAEAIAEQLAGDDGAQRAAATLEAIMPERAAPAAVPV